MEEKKLDINSILGFILIFGILMFMLWQNQPTPEELEGQTKARQEQVEAEKKAKNQEQTKVTSADDFYTEGTTDYLKLVALKNRLGAFTYSAVQPSAEETVVESDLLALKFSNKGGYLSEVKLKNYVDFKGNPIRSEEHTSELQSRENLVCRLLLEKKKKKKNNLNKI